jgi:hypothetical protein
MIQHFRYVPHAKLLVHLAGGWAIADDFAGCRHGEYATLCVWTREGEPAGLVSAIENVAQDR